MKALGSVLARVVLLVSLSACSGQLSLFEDTLGQRCVSSADCGFSQVCSAEERCVSSEGACSPAVPNGDCGRGQICSGGVCVCVDARFCACDGDCLSGWCDCDPGDGCDEGTCLPIVVSGPGANSCAPERPNGLCADGAACCGGSCCVQSDVCVEACIPNERPCSPNEPRGFCGAGLGCNNGRCEPLDQCACSATRTQGCCPDGQNCDGGACVSQSCAPGTPGSCPLGQTCTLLGCETIQCALGHPEGACASGYCSVNGSCIPDGTCGARGDCDEQYCASDSVCRDFETCLVDGDCAIQLGQGYACVAGACVENTTCDASSDCRPPKFCSAAGNCLVPDRCDDDSDCTAGSEYCAGNDVCTPNGCCAISADCGGGKICVERGTCDVCIDLGTCELPSDCPPGYACNGGTNVCELTGQVCNSNDFTASCPPGELSCCASGTCCPFGERCGSIGRCIGFGQCNVEADCVDGFTCVDFRCVPPANNACPCPLGEHCATVRDASGFEVSGCVADGSCAANDCPNDFRCNAEYQCEVNPRCGNEELGVGAIVPPNVLIAFDRSGSMNLCGGGNELFGDCGFNYNGPGCNDRNSGTSCAPCTDDTSCGSGRECTPFGFDDPVDGTLVCSDEQCTANCLDPPTCTQTLTTTRWDEALAAIKGDTGGSGVLGLIDTYLGQVAFGLAMFPQPNPGATCALTCNWTSCSDRNNTSAGVVNVPVALNSRAGIEAALEGTVPGGATTTAGTLRNILALPDRGGLNDPDRSNAVLLVTDGEPTFDSAPVSTCEPPCGDGIENGDETGRDCGGLCPPCLDVGGEACAGPAACDSATCLGADGCAPPACVADDDCFSHLCRSGACRPASCGDELQLGLETDVDCGGPCQPCADSLNCGDDADCASGVCNGGTCNAATCTDGIANGSETGVDCGGTCAAGCANDTACRADSDCQSGFCDGASAVCKPAHCDNGMGPDGGETGVDCGGPCRPCTTQCSNGARDGAETDVDCGGGACPDCPGARSCNGAGDCLSGVCTTCGPSITGAAQSCRVNAAIDRLYSQTPRIKTFVVGFELAQSANLNCNAIHGRTANRAVAGCDALTRTTCDDVGAPTCYYEATDATALQNALDQVIQRVSTCRFDLTGVPISRSQMAVFLEDNGNPEDRAQIFDGVGWRYDSAVNQLELFGSACAQVRGGAKRPIVVFRCGSSG